MIRPSKIRLPRAREEDVEKKSGYPSGGQPVTKLPKVPKGPGPGAPDQQADDRK